jgi:hypothetical protein
MTMRWFDLRLLYTHDDGRQAAAELVNPSVLAERPESLGNRLVHAIGGDFDEVFDALEVPAGDPARSQRHRCRMPEKVNTAVVEITARIVGRCQTF